MLKLYIYLRKIDQPIHGYTHNDNHRHQQCKHHHDGMGCCDKDHGLLCCKGKEK